MINVDERRVHPETGVVRYVPMYDRLLDYKHQFALEIPAKGDVLVLGASCWLVVGRVWNHLVHPDSMSGHAKAPGGLTLIVEKCPPPYADECPVSDWPQPEDDDE